MGYRTLETSEGFVLLKKEIRVSLQITAVAAFGAC
jgi:hypothetical protein